MSDKHLALNTLNSIDLFSEDNNKIVDNHIIIHIPHSSTHIPDYSDFIVDKKIIKSEIDLLTDIDTDIIFDIYNTTKIIAPFNRVFCDVERLPDEKEEMFKYGRGFYYTHSDNGTIIRNVNNVNKKYIYENYYIKHHNKLNNAVSNKLKKYGKVLIIDAHSFSDIPFKTDINQSLNRPDFCLGTDDYHTPNNLLDIAKNKLEKLGYSVGVNNPYSGTIVPLKYYKKNNNVQSIMFEVNKKLYLGDKSRNTPLQLKLIIEDIINSYKKL